MPSGPKKRKAARRKKQKAPVDVHQDDSPTDPNPNPCFVPHPVHPQGNGRDAPIEDDGEDAFATPSFHPETPRLPETPYYSIERVGSGRRVDFEGLGVEIQSDESSKEMKLEESAAAAAAAENYNGVLHQVIASEEGGRGRKDDEGLKEAELDESVLTDVKSSNGKEVKVVPLSDEVMLTDSREVNVEFKRNEKHKGLGVEIQSDESSKEMKLEESAAAAAAENYNGVLHQVIASEEGGGGRKDDEVLKEAKLDESVLTEVKSSNGNEANVVPLSDKVMLIDNREVNVELKRNEKHKGLGVEIQSAESSKEMKLEESAAAAENYNGVLHQVIASEEGEGGRKDDEGLKEVKLDESVLTEVKSSNGKEVKVVPLSDEVMLTDNREVNVELKRNKFLLADTGELIADVDGACSEEKGYIDFRGSIEKELHLNNHEDFTNVVESVPEKMPQIDVDLDNDKLEKSVEKSSVSFENTAVNTEVPSIGNTTYKENAPEPPSDVEETEAAQKNEDAIRPVVARHATFWNCCGLLEVFLKSNR